MLKNLEEKHAKDIESLNLRLETMKIASYEALYEAPKTWTTTDRVDWC